MNTSITSHAARRAGRPPAGFTLLELLVSIAIIFVLLGTALFALKAARGGAERAESLNSLRGLMTAYTSYTNEHNNRLIPGYIDAGDIGTGAGQIDIKARLKSGTNLAAGDTSSYVWRLAPYLDHDWLAYMDDYRDKELTGRLDAEYADGSAAGVYGPGTAGANELGIARVPSFGLNSIFMGGDSTHGPADHSPWNDGKRPYVAQRVADALNPTKIIVFGASRMEPYPVPSPYNLDSIAGYCELRAPQVYDAGGALTSQWTIDMVSGSPTEGKVQWVGGDGGSPVARSNADSIPISHLDGHVESQTLARLAGDLSLWIPNQLTPQ